VIPLYHTQQAAKKKVRVTGSVVTNFFGSSNPYKQHNEQQQKFLKDLVLYICKGYKALSICDNIWLRRLVLDLCPCVLFPFWSQLVEEVLPTMVTKSMDIHVLQKLASPVIVFASFDLWMFDIDMFALVFNYFFEAWEHLHAIVDLFEVNETISSCMA
jgi:hypothetical protein